MQISHISMPYAFISDGTRVLVKEIVGDGVRIGAGVTEKDGVYTLSASHVDPDCIGGVCPIR